MINSNYHLKSLLRITLFVFFLAGCKKLVDVNPPVTKVTTDNAYSSDATAIAVVTGLYAQMSANTYPTISIPTISMAAGLSADELVLWSGNTSTNLIAYYKNTLSINTGGFEFWNNIYPYIFTCNAAIAGINASTSISPLVKQQLLGEAMFLRAFYYFYLVNLYGDVPLVLTTDYNVNATLPRTPKKDVYNQIIADLQTARNYLNDGYVKSDAVTVYSPVSSAERVRPNKSTASALLARVYLYTENWTNADSMATSVISNSTYYKLTSLDTVFLKNSQEAIWQLQPITNNTITNTAEAVFFILSVAPAGVNSSHPVYLNPLLINSFEANDSRKTHWTNTYTDASGTYYYPYKYKVTTVGTSVTTTEYRMMLRLGEQYLIRAEARAMEGNLAGAITDLNIIRNRAGLPATTATMQSDILKSIQHERQVELFTEMGQRWLDLKRTNSIDSVMSVVVPSKNTTWSTIQQLYPLPLTDIQRDPKLIQNPGY